MPKTTTPPTPSTLWNSRPISEILEVNNHDVRQIIVSARGLARTALDQAVSDDQLRLLVQFALTTGMVFTHGYATASLAKNQDRVLEAAAVLADPDTRSDLLDLDDVFAIKSLLPNALDYMAEAYQLSRGEFLHQVAEQRSGKEGFIIRRAAFCIKFSVQLVGVLVGIPPRKDDWVAVPHGDGPAIPAHDIADDDHPVDAEAATAFAMGIEAGKASDDADEGAVQFMGMDDHQSQDPDDTVGMWKAGETIAMDGRLYVSQGQHQVHGRDALNPTDGSMVNPLTGEPIELEEGRTTWTTVPPQPDPLPIWAQNVQAHMDRVRMTVQRIGNVARAAGLIPPDEFDPEDDDYESPCHCTADDCEDCHPDQDGDRDPSSVRQDALQAPAAGPNVGATTGYHLTRNEWPDGTVEVTLTVQVLKGTERVIMQRLADVGAAIL